MANSSTKPHAAILCSMGLGHVIPCLELGKHLVSHFNYRVTFFLLTLIDSPPPPKEKQILESTMKPGLLEYIQISVDISSILPPNAPLGLKLFHMPQQASPLLVQAISSMESKPTMLIGDIFGTGAFSAADELNMLKYVFSPNSAWFVALILYSPTLDKMVKGDHQYIDEKESLKIPGCKPVQPVDLFDPMLDRSDKLYQAYLVACARTNKADGILTNSWPELESATFAAMNEGKLGGVVKAPVYGAGPLIRQPKDAEKREGNVNCVFEWLDKQSEESVIYVGFGSGATLSHEQTKEVAFGLEQSGHKFVWLVRSPTKKTGDDHYFSGGKVNGGVSEDHEINNELSSLSYLPQEFLSRTKYKVGLVVSDWAPQLHILRHPSVGGFFSHCGWSSILESITSGVPMVACPLFAEQRMNAAFLEEEVGIAVRAKAMPSTENLIPREEIAKLIKKIMDKEDKQGCAMRAKVKQLKKGAEEAISKNKSSYSPFSELARAY